MYRYTTAAPLPKTGGPAPDRRRQELFDVLDRSSVTPEIRRWLEGQPTKLVESFYRALTANSAPSTPPLVEPPGGLKGADLVEFKMAVGEPIRARAPRGPSRDRDGSLRIGNVAPSEWRRIRASRGFR